jgi:hypothetical protein
VSLEVTDTHYGTAKGIVRSWSGDDADTRYGGVEVGHPISGTTHLPDTGYCNAAISPHYKTTAFTRRPMMPAAVLLTNIDDQIRQIETDLKNWKTFREMLATSPSMIEQIQRVTFNPKSNGLINPVAVSQLKTIAATRVKQLQDFFKSRNNEWHQVDAIRDGTGLTRNIIKGMVHFRYSKLFERKDEGWRKVFYRLSQLGLDLTDYDDIPQGRRPPGYDETHRKHNEKVRARKEQARLEAGLPKKKKPIPRSDQEEEQPVQIPKPPAKKIPLPEPKHPPQKVPLPEPKHPNPKATRR